MSRPARIDRERTVEFRIGDRVRVTQPGFSAAGVITVAQPYAHEVPDGRPERWAYVRFDRDAHSYPQLRDELTCADDHSHVTDMPDPRDDALDLIAEAVCAFDLWTESERLDEALADAAEAERDAERAHDDERHPGAIAYCTLGACVATGLVGDALNEAESLSANLSSVRDELRRQP